MEIGITTDVYGFLFLNSKYLINKILKVQIYTLLLGNK
jgi:hypothetical protein